MHAIRVYGDERKDPPGKPGALTQCGGPGSSDERKDPPGKPGALKQLRGPGSDERKDPPGKPGAFKQARSRSSSWLNGDFLEGRTRGTSGLKAIHFKRLPIALHED